ncbi:MAG: bifunctional methylenetetrahydrofolate dehydrogenase/methenyltetrahydrofolate cyclohydrolase FolD [Reyranellaceae bacterium]
MSPTPPFADKRIDGKAHAERLRARIAVDAADFAAKAGMKAGLAVVLVGDDAASQVYVASKGKQTREAGMESFQRILPASTTQAELLAVVRELNADSRVHGILVQMPLPAQLDNAAIVAAIDPEKDVDGLHPLNAGKLAQLASGAALDFSVPCTPLGCLMLLQERLGSLAGQNALVIGRSILVGKPMAALLLREDCTVTIAHSRTRNLPELCRQADILVAAIGRQHFVKGDWVKEGAAVIDVGITRIDIGNGKTRLVGDVDFAAAAPRAAAITPVPGGVGPMTVACLLYNTLQAAKRQANLS